jgi:hypothetical protein
MFSRFLNILSVAALLPGIGLTTTQTVSLASLTAPGSTVLEYTQSTGNVYAQADAGIQLVAGVLLITLGFFLHALARMRNGERPVHITVKPKAKRRMWYWVDMRI